MLAKKLLNIRLSYIYPALFVIFLVILTKITPSKLSTGQLALYSVNTFLFAFYFSPILSAQKARVEGLNQAIRHDVMSILDILAQSHLLSNTHRHELKLRLKIYIDSINHDLRVSADNLYYDELLRFTKQEKFKDDSVMDSIYTKVAKTQEDRDNMQSLYISNVFSHEWLVVLVLFGVTLFFVMQTNYNGVFLFRVLLAILCTGLSLMLIILVKYATLTHKQAKRIWQPVDALIVNHFEDVDSNEIARLRKSIDSEEF